MGRGAKISLPDNLRFFGIYKNGGINSPLPPFLKIGVYFVFPFC